MDGLDRSRDRLRPQPDGSRCRRLRRAASHCRENCICKVRRVRWDVPHRAVGANVKARHTVCRLNAEPGHIGGDAQLSGVVFQARPRRLRPRNLRKRGGAADSEGSSLSEDPRGSVLRSRRSRKPNGPLPLAMGPGSARPKSEGRTSFGTEPSAATRKPGGSSIGGDQRCSPGGSSASGGFTRKPGTFSVGGSIRSQGQPTSGRKLNMLTPGKRAADALIE